MLKSITFEVVGDERLHCESCERRVERVLKNVQGIRQVHADASSQLIEVLFEASELKEHGILDQIRLLGYSAEAAVGSGHQSSGMNHTKGNS